MTELERLRRDAGHRWSPREHGDFLAVRTYDVGTYVWCCYGHGLPGVQLARVKIPGPIAFDGRDREWWWVDVFWPTKGRWIQSHRRVLRALTPAELVALSTSGVMERGA